MVGVLQKQLMVWVIECIFDSIDRRTIDGLGYRVSGRCNQLITIDCLNYQLSVSFNWLTNYCWLGLLSVC